MLDQTTKRKIDSARQILVGKVPDPKQQVDQITNALIYKFMDDMDKEAQELGGEVKFFTNGFEKYSWTKLLDKRLSGQERLDLYVQAISNMSKNPHVPQLFRDVFKDAFLPYRDPETLSLFLKEINEFTYDHSENLGNAFEYLLSILGSQGDAGQFRTPRHIIDFIVEVISPKKDETILDPACGTAGFLISAYKHIVASHDGKDNKTGKSTDKEILLTPDEKTKLMNNIVGYDISPDMVKLSLVNMYLHGFQEPKIYEYDSLTSEKHWGESFDVIMANPPFMTPKGGIRPHKRFAIQANRSEVLFVDYIMEHLNINGRAGIIVPEGIIFKSENAYKTLRKKLVEDGLFAVVSLPAGVFNPYSGVKTSILFFDNQLAKKTDEILFVKVLNDGFDLGAQRRPRPDLSNDLFDKKGALDVLRAQSIAIQTGNKNSLTSDKSAFAWTVKKEKVAENGDYNLTGERYKEIEVHKNQKWPLVKLQAVATIDWGNTELTKKSYIEDGKFLGVSATGCDGRINHFEHNVGVTVLSAIGANCGRMFYPTEKFTAIKNTITFTPDRKKLEPKFLFYIMKNNSLPKRGGGQPFMSKGDVEKYKIPLPSLEVQKEIVEQIEVKQNAINHAREIIKNLERERRYFDQELRKLEDVKVVMLSEICEINSETADPKAKFKSGDFVYVDISSVENGGTGRVSLDNLLPVAKAPSRARRLVQNNDVIISTVRPNLKAFALLQNLPERTVASTGFTVLRADSKIDPRYLYFIVSTDSIVQQMTAKMGKGSYPSINENDVKQIKIPLPPLEIQKQLVAEAEKEEEIIASNRRLIEVMEKKINNVLNQI